MSADMGVGRKPRSSF